MEHKQENLTTVNRLLAMAHEINDMAVRVSNEEIIGDVGAWDAEGPLHDAAEAVAFTAISVAFANDLQIRAEIRTANHAE